MISLLNRNVQRSKHSAQSDREQAMREGNGLSLKLEGVSKVFAGRAGTIQALEQTNLDIAAGEFVCLLGPSGCGKSTLLSIIAGLEPPTTGTIWADGREISGAGTDRVLLFQDAALFPWLDVQSNVEFGLRHAGVPAKERADQARRFIERVNLQGFERSYTHQLSGGMRQRVAIARALVLNPSILLMDEPFGALDAFTRDALHTELELIWTETRKTVVFVTHNVREALALGDRILLFSPRPGRIVREFHVDLPRPRSLEDYALVDQAAEILAVLHAEMATQGQEV